MLYSEYNSYVDSRTPIWMSNIHTQSTDQCISTRNPCQFSTVSKCNHNKDITIECSMFPYNFISYYSLLAYYNDIKPSTTDMHTCLGKTIIID